MAASQSGRTLDELTLGRGILLEDLVDRGGLGEMVQTIYDHFKVPLRIFNEKGVLLADVTQPYGLYRYLDGFKGARAAVQRVITNVKAAEPGPNGQITEPCVTGALYRVIGIAYDTAQIGRLILGPFVPPELNSVPSSLLELDAGLDPERVAELLAEMPHASESAVDQVAQYLTRTLDLVLFSGHKALLTSSMHLATVRDSYRELQDKNARLQEAYDRLKQLDRLKSNFLATVSHELRTPLTSIIGYSEMLAEGIAGNLTPEQLEFVQTIREKGEQLLELIKGLLDLSKLESGTMTMRKGQVDVEPLLQNVAQTLAPTARKKGVNLTTDVESGLPLMWADPERMRQVLLNLTENAIKFTPSDGFVALAAHSTFMDSDPNGEDGGLVLLSHKRLAIELRVGDTGIGIPDSERAKVFDAFYQVDSSSTREQGGTGLGLSIVKRLVEAHEGTVRIEDNVPKGTVFIVTIPCRRGTVY